MLGTEKTKFLEKLESNLKKKCNNTKKDTWQSAGNKSLGVF